MSGYGQPSAPRAAAPGGQQQQTTQIVSYVAGGLGVLMFVWGFLKWFTEGSGDGQLKLGGYAVSSPVGGAIACSLLAGILVLLHTVDKKPAGLLPLALSATSLLLVIGTFIGKGSISSGGSSEKIGAGIGLILGLITALLQTGALGYLHFGLGAGSGTPAAASTWQPSSGYGQPPATGGYGPQTGSPQYGAPAQQPPTQPGQPSYGSYGGGQQAPQQPRPPAPSYGQPGGSPAPQSPPPAPSQQPTQHLPGGNPPPPSGPPSGPPSSAQPPAPGQYGPPSQYGQPGQNPPPGQYGPPQR